MRHVRLKVFPSISSNGGKIKYLQPRRSGVRWYFPLATLAAVLHPGDSLWAIEGEKKSLAVAQLGLPAIGFSGIEGWHTRGSRELLRDFDVIPLDGRRVELVPDGDVASKVAVMQGARRFADALRAVGARPRLARLPQELPR
jgi:hypothetical protein